MKTCASPTPTARTRRGLGRPWLTATLLLMSALTWLGAVPQALAEDNSSTNRDVKARLDAVETSLTDAEQRLDFVEKEYVQRKDASDEQLIAERFAKGSAQFTDGDYTSASVMFYDLVGMPAFKNDPNYDEALYFLAESLFQQNNYLGARTYFRELLNLHRSHYKQALGRYLEISGRINEFSDIEQYVDAARGPGGRLPAEVSYVYGKWLFRRSDMPLAQRAKRAIEVLEPIASSQTDQHLQAEYLIGVLEVQQGNLDEANEAFNRIVKQGAKDKREQQVQELAHLAIGRIAYEQGKYTEAIDAYQEIDRDSENFIPALYEIAWVFVKKGDYEKALRATELLDEIAPDSTTAPEAQILTAHLHLKLARYGEAQEGYKNVINKYGIIYENLKDLLRVHDDPVKYFDDMLAQNDKDFNIASLLPPEAVKFATTQQDVADALRMTGDIGASRRGVTESNEIAAAILKSVAEKGANAFPVLQEGFSKAEAVDATLTQQQQNLLAAQQALLAGKMGDLQQQLDEARRERETLESKFHSLPKSEAELAERKSRYRDTLTKLDRAIFDLQVQVDGMNAALNAVEKWVNDTRAERQQRGNDPAAERDFLTQVHGERVEVGEIGEELTALHKAIKDEQLRSGNVSADEQVRSQYQMALDKEHHILSQVQSQLGTEGQQLSARIQAITNRLDNDRTRVASAKNQLQTAVAAKADAIRRQVEEEQGKLRGYSGEVDVVAGDARNLVGRIAYDSIKRVRKQFYDLVLKADVGLVDVAWTKKQDDTNKIQQLSKQKDRELKSLDDEFKEVLKDVD